MAQYCYNGDFYKEDCAVFTPANRAFRYGDALFETVFASYTECHLLKEHLDRLKRGMQVMGMIVPSDFNERLFIRKIRRLLNKNHHIKGARIRIAVFRNDGGLYTPTDNTISYIIESEGMDNTKFLFNKEGYEIDIYTDIQKQYNLLSEFKSSNSSLFTMAGLWRKKMNLDDCIILNDDGNICETMSSNIFLVKDDKFYTPSIKSGCVNGIMRNLIVALLRDKDVEVDDEAILTEKHVYEADELFITNSISGIRKVLKFRDKMYMSLLTRQLFNRLNESL